MDRFDLGLLALTGRVPAGFHTGAVAVEDSGFGRWGWMVGVAAAALGVVAIVKGLAEDTQKKVTRLTEEAEALEKSGNYAEAQAKRSMAFELVRSARADAERSGKERECGREAADQEIARHMHDAQAAEAAAAEAAQHGLEKDAQRFRAAATAARQRAVDVAYTTYFLNQAQRQRVEELRAEADAAEQAGQRTDAMKLRAEAERVRVTPGSPGPLEMAAKRSGRAKTDEVARDAAQEALLILMDPQVCRPETVKDDRYGKYLLQYAAARASRKECAPLLGPRVESFDVVSETERGEAGQDVMASPSMQSALGWTSLSDVDPCTQVLAGEEKVTGSGITRANAMQMVDAAGLTEEEAATLMLGAPIRDESGEIVRTPQGKEARITEKMLAAELGFASGAGGEAGAEKVRRIKKRAEQKLDSHREQMRAGKQYAREVELTTRRLLSPEEVLYRERQRQSLPAYMRTRRTVEDPLQQLARLGCDAGPAERRAQIIREAAIVERAEAAERLRGEALRRRLSQIAAQEAAALSRLRRSA